MALPWDEVQGNIYPGFKKDHQSFLFVRFPGTDQDTPDAQARAWLDELRPSIAAAEEVLAFNELFRILRRRRPGREAEAAQATWANVGFTYQGLQKLLTVPADVFPSSFRAGMHGRAAALGDVTDEMPGWLVGGSKETEADAILLLAADLADDLADEIARQRRLLAKHGLTELVRLDGETLGDAREHFGFRDGISQPVPVERADLATTPQGVLAGEFILGLDRDAHLTEDPAPPAWARNGSYLVFRRLRQNVAAFRAGAAAAAATLTNAQGSVVTAERFEALCLGRWKDGVPVSRPPTTPGDTPPSLEITAQDLRDDPAGLKMPRFSHVRKVHPRDRDGDRPTQRRLIRRGITYGPPLPDGAPNDGADRGILFLAYQASIADQFEFITITWMNTRRFPSPGSTVQQRPRDSAGEDPIAGAFWDRPAEPRTIFCPVSAKETGGRLTVDAIAIKLDRYVTMTGGGYFFCPSISALGTLAAGDAV
jgi:Dyp-type peroxidase family